MEKKFMWAMVHLICIIIGAMCITMGNVVGGGVVIGFNALCLILRIIDIVYDN